MLHVVLTRSTVAPRNIEDQPATRLEDPAAFFDGRCEEAVKPRLVAWIAYVTLRGLLGVFLPVVEGGTREYQVHRGGWQFRQDVFGAPVADGGRSPGRLVLSQGGHRSAEPLDLSVARLDPHVCS